jgi:hypothetical protein
MGEIIKGNIIIINAHDTEPSMAIIPKIDFQTCKISDIFRKIHKLSTQFPNCNFNNSSFLYDNKYKLKINRNDITLSEWFQNNKIQKDEYNNYIFYIKKNTKPSKNNKKRHNKKITKNKKKHSNTNTQKKQ